MKIQSVALTNFGSYKNLSFDFENQGLTLIQGATGAGKSTLMDAIPWILFGTTAKGGKVDEIHSWNSEGPTLGMVTIRGLHSDIVIRRSRSPSDLTLKYSEESIRGKDVADTQKLINQKLGFDAETYLAAAYFHEFSQTAQFFTTTAKSRRETLEQIVDLSMASRLQAKASEAAKAESKAHSELLQQIYMFNSNISLLTQMQAKEQTKAQDWTRSQDYAISKIRVDHAKYDANRDRVISGKCDECGTQLEADVHIHDTKANPYQERLIDLLNAQNPHTGSVTDYTADIDKKRLELDGLANQDKDFRMKLADLDILKDTISIFRGRLVQDTVSYIQTETNALLTKHFDAEIQVEFHIDNDKLDVNLLKDGNEAAFTQLSKGQRQLLKLSFAVSVMKAASNFSGVDFQQVFFDEALSGLDDNMKSKAFGLLEELAVDKDSVFVIDHSEGFKAMFPNVYNVELVNGNSVICQN